MRQARNSSNQAVRRFRSVLYLVAATLCLCHSVAQGQEAWPARLATFQPSVTLSGTREAQPRPASFEVSGGTAGVASSIEVSAVELLTLILEISDVQHYEEHPAAGLRFSHESTEIKLALPVMHQSRFSFFADFGLGTTRLRSHDPGQMPVPGYYRISETFLSALGGLTVQYQPTDVCRAFVSARHFVYLNDAEDLALDAVPNPDQLLDSSSWTFPISFGLQLSFD